MDPNSKFSKLPHPFNFLTEHELVNFVKCQFSRHFLSTCSNVFTMWDVLLTGLQFSGPDLVLPGLWFGVIKTSLNMSGISSELRDSCHIVVSGKLRIFLHFSEKWLEFHQDQQHFWLREAPETKMQL